jgi:dihydrodipicolinate reductase
MEEFENVTIDFTSPEFIIKTLNLLIEEGQTQFSYDDIQLIASAMITLAIGVAHGEV